MDCIAVYGNEAIAELVQAGFTPLTYNGYPHIVTSYFHRDIDKASDKIELFEYTDKIRHFIIRGAVRYDGGE